jgi:hypothetical protein
MKTINQALALGYNPVKVNCVVMKGVNDDEIVDFVRWTKEQPVRKLIEASLSWGVFVQLLKDAPTLYCRSRFGLSNICLSRETLGTTTSLFRTRRCLKLLESTTLSLELLTPLTIHQKLMPWRGGKERLGLSAA